MSQDAARQELAALGRVPNAAFDAIEAALALAEADDPESPIEPARAAWRALEQSARDALVAHPHAQGGIAEARGRFLAGRLRDQGFAGDNATYDDPANANLARVLVRRKGLPVALGLIWIGLSRRLGWTIEGIDLPGRFVVRIADDQSNVLFDPFDAGRILDWIALRQLNRALSGRQADLEPGDLAAMTDRQVVLRLANNLRVRRIDAGDYEAALSVTEDMGRLAPAVPSLMIAAGELALHVGRPMAAIAHLGRFLATDPPADERRAAKALLDKARQTLN